MFFFQLRTFFLLLFLPVLLQAQTTTPFGANERKEVVTKVSQLLLDNYVYPDTAKQMAAQLNKRLKEGAYDKITDPVVFSDRINQDMLSVYHDGHLQLQYNPVSPSTIIPTQEVMPPLDSDPFHAIKQANFGISSVEILTGNVGYINLEHFWADGVYGRKNIKAALQLVQYTNGLIIDLRTNGGGSPESVAQLCGFFFDKKVHVNDSYSRPDNRTTAFWGTPDTSLKALVTMPLYILTSSKTFSAAEEFAYDMQNLKRATIVGETTGGGAHNTFEQPAGNDFVLYIPYGRAVNPVTHSNWEGTGVKPDVAVPADKALSTAQEKIILAALGDPKNVEDFFSLEWQLDLLHAQINPVIIDTLQLKKFAGVYGERTFTFENGKLYYQRTGKPKFELEPMTATIMKGKGNTYFKIEFIENSAGEVNEVKAYYQDQRIESSQRTK